MRPSDSMPAHDWMEARVEAYLDGDLPADERAVFESWMAADQAWAEAVLLSRRIREGLRRLPQPACPPGVTQAVLAEVRRRERTAWAEGVRQWIERYRWSVLQPALTTGALVLLVIASTWVGPAPQQPSQAEVERALAEAKWALAYLSEVGRETGLAVRNEVIEPHVVLPAQHAVGTILPASPIEALPTE